MGIGLTRTKRGHIKRNVAIQRHKKRKGIIDMKEIEITLLDARGDRYTIYAKVPKFTPLALIRRQFVDALGQLSCRLESVSEGT